TLDGPLPDLIYPELYAIAGLMRENLKKQYANVRREELIWRYCSHELRTPISIINIGLELLQKTLARSGRDATQEIRVIARLERATHSMSHLVTTLLWLGRNDMAPLQQERIELSLFVGSIVSDFLKIFPHDREKVRLRTSRHMATVPAPALRIILENIIRNAFQHAREGRICILQKGGRILVTNSMQAGNSLRENTGFGLGLELTERLAGKLGWEFSYTRRGRHARAELRLPG
ncbi:MAG: sensor histidine kinase, partial [Desulfovibrio sp.]|nr:sensor histidine kinase [Desulfovibrio sp.]